MNDDISISLKWNGLKGSAECHVDGRSFYADGRTQAHALSLVVGKMGRHKDLIGKAWRCSEIGLSGVIGEKIARPRRTYTNVAELALVGGEMAGRAK